MPSRHLEISGFTQSTWVQSRKTKIFHRNIWKRWAWDIVSVEIQIDQTERGYAERVDIVLQRSDGQSPRDDTNFWLIRFLSNYSYPLNLPAVLFGPMKSMAEFGPLTLFDPLIALVTGEKSNFQYILRLLNTNVDGKQKIMYALARIKGVGRRYSNLVCKKADVDLNKRYVGYNP